MKPHAQRSDFPCAFGLRCTIHNSGKLHLINRKISGMVKG